MTKTVELRIPRLLKWEDESSCFSKNYYCSYLNLFGLYRQISVQLEMDRRHLPTLARRYIEGVTIKTLDWLLNHREWIFDKIVSEGIISPKEQWTEMIAEPSEHLLCYGVSKTENKPLEKEKTSIRDSIIYDSIHFDFNTQNQLELCTVYAKFASTELAAYEVEISLDEAYNIKVLGLVS